MRNGGARHRWNAEERRLWRDVREAALAVISETKCRIIDHALWLVCVACMRDTTGSEIERHLERYTEEFRLAVYGVCLREHWAGYGRTWEDWRARRLAVICIFLVSLCQRSTYHAAVVWVVRGIPKRAIAIATRISTQVHGAGYVQAPHGNTLYGDLCELQRAGILDWEQFDAHKVPKWCRGNLQTNRDGSPKLDKNGRQMQWAFSYYFLLICPFPGGADGAGRLVSIPRGKSMRERKQILRRNAETQTDRDARHAVERDATQQRAAEYEHAQYDVDQVEADMAATPPPPEAVDVVAYLRRAPNRYADKTEPTRPATERERFADADAYFNGPAPPEPDDS